MHTPDRLVTPIIGADISIIAPNLLPTDALPTLADIPLRTGISVLTARYDRHMYASIPDLAGVVGAHLAIITSAIVRRMHTPHRPLAAIERAPHTIITFERDANTGARLAAVLDRTRVIVVTRRR